MDAFKNSLSSLADKAMKTPPMEVKVKEATNDDPWGPHGTQMQELAEATNFYEDKRIILDATYKRLQLPPQKARNIYKALLLAEHLMKNGSDLAVEDIKSSQYILANLQEFYYTENGKDLGSNIRERARKVVAILNDPTELEQERSRANQTRYKCSGFSNSGSIGGSGISSSSKYDGISRDTYRPSKFEGRRGSEDDGKRGGGGGAYDSYDPAPFSKKKKRPVQQEEDEEEDDPPARAPQVAVVKISKPPTKTGGRSQATPGRQISVTPPHTAPNPPAPAPVVAAAPAAPVAPKAAPAPPPPAAPAASIIDDIFATPVAPTPQVNIFSNTPAQPTNLFAPPQPTATINPFGQPTPAPAAAAPTSQDLFGPMVSGPPATVGGGGGGGSAADDLFGGWTEAAAPKPVEAPKTGIDAALADQFNSFTLGGAGGKKTAGSPNAKPSGGMSLRQMQGGSATSGASFAPTTTMPQQQQQPGGYGGGYGGFPQQQGFGGGFPQQGGGFGQQGFGGGFPQQQGGFQGGFPQQSMW